MAEAPDRYCGNCGHELSPEDKFCRNCGTPAHVAARVPTPEADAPVPPPPPEGASEVASPPEGTVLQKWKPLIWGLVGAVILGALISAVQGGGGSPSQSGSGNQQQGQQQGQQQQAEAQQAADSPPERAEQDEGVEGGGPEPEAKKPLQGEKVKEEKPKPPPQKTYSIGQTATVGNVVWTVTDAYRTTLLRSNFGTQKRGNFVVVDFTFTNNRSEEVTLDPELHMVLKDSQGREFGTDPDAWEFVPTRLDIFLEPVNPGLSQNGRVVYEVPPDAGGFVLILDDVEFWEDKKARYDLGAMPARA